MAVSFGFISIAVLGVLRRVMIFFTAGENVFFYHPLKLSCTALITAIFVLSLCTLYFEEWNALIPSYVLHRSCEDLRASKQKLQNWRKQTCAQWDLNTQPSNKQMDTLLLSHTSWYLRSLKVKFIYEFNAWPHQIKCVLPRIATAYSQILSTLVKQPKSAEKL